MRQAVPEDLLVNIPSFLLGAEAAAALQSLHLLNLVLDFRAVVTSEELKNNPDVLFKGCVFLDHSTLFYCATKLTLFQFICVSEDCI